MVITAIATAVRVRESSLYLASWRCYKVTVSKWEARAEKGDGVDNEEEESGPWLLLP